jgi:PPOX class probable F420-dependent enzyme
MLDPEERTYLETGRVARLATADSDARPHAVPICYALLDDTTIITPIDEKPQTKGAHDLRRTRDIAENPHVAVLVDHYTDDWTRLGWLKIHGTAEIRQPDDDIHDAITALRTKYEQYQDHALEDRPIIHIIPGSSTSWGELERPDHE